jgi:NDP-mannose synthase
VIELMKAVILAGGLGQRLRPFTELIPKPLLPIGESSVLEIQIRTLARSGVSHVFIATNHLSDYVEEHLGDGSAYGVPVRVSREPIPLGTCGPVALLESELQEPFLLINGDVLTTLDFARVYEFACARATDLTVVTKEIIAPFAFGQVIGDGDFVAGVQEKPDLKFEILAGIYVVKPPVFQLIPRGQYYGIDSLIRDMLAAGRPVGRYVCADYWLDIGDSENYRTAQADFRAHFSHLSRGETR